MKEWEWQHKTSCIDLVSAPDLHVTPARKRVWYLTSEFLVVLSQHVRKMGNPIRSLDSKLSCECRTARACAHRQTGYGRRKLVLYHMIVRSNYTISLHADSAQPRKRMLDTTCYVRVWDPAKSTPQLNHREHNSHTPQCGVCTMYTQAVSLPP